MSGLGMPTGIRELGAGGRSEWVASIFAAVDSQRFVACRLTYRYQLNFYLSPLPVGFRSGA
jgi:hypothetical protein